MSIPVSIKMRELLGKRVVLTRGFAGYSAGSTAIVEEFAVTADCSFFRLRFEAIPGSLEDMRPVVFARSVNLVGPGGVPSTVGKYFIPGPPPQDRPYNLSVS
jgi:hypothetical protein